jgi:thermostable 8-oxoguanine DNA glycosylase
MTQTVHRYSSSNRVETLNLPSPTERVFGSIKWGKYTVPYTPAFWKAYTWLREDAPSEKNTLKSGHGDIRRETVLCLLGGYGIKAEVAYAFYNKLQAEGIIDENSAVSCARIRQILASPTTENGRSYRYRFPNIKARYLAGALRIFSDEVPPARDLELRDWLLRIPGVGPKTAGWIVRNCLGSDNVAIIDVHLHRAGRHMKLFDDRALAVSSYSYFEGKFLQFARALEVKAGLLDLVIWETVRQDASGLNRN